MKDNTNIIARLSPSSIHAFASILNILLIGFSFLALAVFVSPFFILAFVLLMGLGLYRYLYIVFTEYIISEETITSTTGIIAKNIDITELYRVKDYVIKQTAFQRIFNLMTVTLITSDFTNPQLNLVGIPKSNIIEVIRTLVQQARIRNKVFEIN